MACVHFHVLDLMERPLFSTDESARTGARAAVTLDTLASDAHHTVI